VSLNNRIAIRDKYAARGGLVIMGNNNPQKDLMGQRVAQTEVRESKSHGGHVMVPFSHDLILPTIADIP
jgi:hypothetical protein